MPRLIQIENIKTFSSNTFRVIISLHLLFFVLVLLSISRVEVSLGEFSVSRLYQFPDVWEFFPWIASWFNILLAVLIIVLTCNEFRYNTFRQQVMNGLHEGHLLLGKIYIILVIAVYALLLVVVSGVVSGSLQAGPQSSLMDLSGFQHVGIYLLQTVAYMSMALLFAVLLRNNGLAIIIFILYLFPGEVILRNVIFPSVESYFPAKLISDLTPLPSMFTSSLAPLQGSGFQMGTTVQEGLTVAQSTGFAALYVVVFLGITYWVLRKRSI
ncbi:MAG: ABC transporter permease [Bacteroidales bacterium]|nr:ABC transporter permease [Bacteroidales bacterium]